jgi:hypothetical protein
MEWAARPMIPYLAGLFIGIVFGYILGHQRGERRGRSRVARRPPFFIGRNFKVLPGGKKK